MADNPMTHPSPEAVEARTCNGNLQVEIAFLEEASRYFENRPTHGEDRAHWSNVHNAENCRKVISTLTRETARADKAVAEAKAQIAREMIARAEGLLSETDFDGRIAHYKQHAARALKEYAATLAQPAADGGGFKPSAECIAEIEQIHRGQAEAAKAYLANPGAYLVGKDGGQP